MRARNVKILISLGLVVGAIALLMVTATTRSGYTTHYYRTASEFLARAPEYVDLPVRVNGKVVAGSIRRGAAAREGGPPIIDFVLGDSAATIPVHYEGTTVPDAFREGADVVVEGTYTAGGVLAAKQLLVKCPSKYESAPTPNGQTAEGRT